MVRKLITIKYFVNVTMAFIAIKAGYSVRDIKN